MVDSDDPFWHVTRREDLFVCVPPWELKCTTRLEAHEQCVWRCSPADRNSVKCWTHLIRARMGQFMKVIALHCHLRRFPIASHTMSDLSPPPSSPFRTHAMSPPASSSPEKKGPLDPSSSSSPVPNENMSPSRKAILDRFNKINMGPPPADSRAQPEFAAGAGGAKLSSSSSPSRSGRNSRSPFKRALMNSQRSNTGNSGSGSPSKHLLAPMPSSDVSLSLNFSSSVRLSANTSVEYDLMNAPDDSLLAEAKLMGEESFERKLMQNCSPSVARRRMSPKRDQRQSPLRRSAPAPAPELGNSLGLGLPSFAQTQEHERRQTQAQADSSSTGIRSLSMSSDVSNIFDEKGEESLLYASMRIKARSPGKRGAGGQDQKLLSALAEGKEEDVFGVKEDKDEDVATQSKASVPHAVTSPSVKRTATSSSALTARPKPSVPAPDSRMTPSNSRDKLVSPTVKKTQPSTTPRLSTATRPSAAGPASVSASTRAPPASSASVLGRAPPASTPRSRPPLNASAARFRRLSALPQLMDEQGRPKAPTTAPRVSTAARPVVKATTTQQVASPVRSTAASSTSPVVRRTIGRPSVAGGTAAPSAAPPRPRPAIATPAHRMNDSPKTSSRISRGGAAGATPSRTERAVAPVPVRGSAVSGQLHRRAPSMLPPSDGTTNAAAAATGAVKKPLARPFLLGKGTNHSVHGESPPLHDTATLHESPRAPRKSVATTRVTPATGRMGIPKSSSVGQVAPRGGTVGAGIPMTARRTTTAATATAGTALPRPSLARPA